MDYDLIVIGGGTAGLTAAGFAGKVGAKTALIEKHRLGGDCTWTGCVPSKSLLKVSKVAHAIRTSSHYGINAGTPQVDMPRVRDYVQNVVHDIYQHETPEVFSDEYNVEVIIGEAHFVDEHTLQVNDRQLTAGKIIIATGSRPNQPALPGLASVPYVTNETIFENDRLPEHLLVIGAGPIGLEMGQAYARLGAQVTVIDSAIFKKEAPQVREVMQPILEREGVRFVASQAKAVESTGQNITAQLESGDRLTGDMLLVAVGRTPNVESLDLEKAGIAYDSTGIRVDDYLRTNHRHIFAIGDCIAGPKFTHYAGSQASAAAQNALFPVINVKGHDEVLPRVTYTEPEVAHVGFTEAEARQKYGASVKVYHFPMTESDRGMTENDSAGFIRIIYRGSGNLLGATIVAEQAGEMITEFSLLLRTKLKLTDIVSTMHAYPTYSFTVRKAISLLVIDELFKGTTGRLIKTAARILF